MLKSGLYHVYKKQKLTNIENRVAEKMQKIIKSDQLSEAWQRITNDMVQDAQISSSDRNDDLARHGMVTEDIVWKTQSEKNAKGYEDMTHFLNSNE